MTRLATGNWYGLTVVPGAVLVVLLICGVSVAAQSATPVATPMPSRSAELLSDAEFLGPSWELADEAWFRVTKPMTTAVYVGPRGGRIRITVVDYGEFGPENLDHWERMRGVMSEIGPNQTPMSEASEAIEPELRQIPGCIEVLQARGREPLAGTFAEFPVARTLCLVQSGVILDVTASGEYRGRVGVEAANLLIETLVPHFTGDSR